LGRCSQSAHGFVKVGTVNGADAGAFGLLDEVLQAICLECFG
jgi:hypothetical protein